eukprot:s692_g6.t1
MGWTSHSPPAEKGLGLTIKSEDPHLSRTRSRLFTVQILQPKISNTSEDAEVRETSRFWYVLLTPQPNDQLDAAMLLPSAYSRTGVER